MLLGAVLEHGWISVDLERWIAMDGVGGRIVIVRHDVDQHPATAVRMARIDARHGVKGTWYFRWRTASPQAIEAIRELGGTIGFHYETLTRVARHGRLSPEAIGEDEIQRARSELKQEIRLFQQRFGPIRSICAHGDTRVQGVSNQVLAKELDPREVGVFDANEALSRYRLGLWMTDRAASDGRWKDGIDPVRVLRESQDPILCLTHPNNWCSGLSLWSDRLRAALLPTPGPDVSRPLLGMRTGGDNPPQSAPAPEGRTEAKPT